MPTWKPETPTAAVPSSLDDFDLRVRVERDANGKKRYFCTVEPHGHGKPETFRLGEVECAENAKAKRAAFRAAHAELVNMWQAKHVDGATPLAAVNDEDEVVTP